MKYVLLAVLVVMISATTVAVCFLRARERLQEGKELSGCVGNIYGLGHALHRYSSVHGDCFPPAYLIGPDGKPWHSWRVLILPHLPEDHQDLYNAYRFDEPWNGPNNSKLSARMPRFYACPSDSDARRDGCTNYFAVVGPGTAFPDDGRSAPFNWPVARHQLLAPDGRLLLRSPSVMSMVNFLRPAETILVVESTGRGINWLEPRDISFAEMNDPKAVITARHRTPFIVTVDLKTLSLDHYDSETLRRMCLVDPDKKPEAKGVGKAFSE